MKHPVHKSALASLILLTIAGCSNPSDSAMIGQWQMDCSTHPAMSSLQKADISTVNTIELTVDADSFFFRSRRGNTSLSNWRYGYQVLKVNATSYALEAAIKGKIVRNIQVEVVNNNQLVFSDNWYHDQLIPLQFKSCTFVKNNG